MHNPFECGEKLIRLDSELTDEDNSINCDKAEEVGAEIQSKLNGIIFQQCSFKRKDKISNLRYTELTCSSYDR